MHWLLSLNPSVSDLELPDTRDPSAELVDSDDFWKQVNLGILYRGLIRGKPALGYFLTVGTANVSLEVSS